MNNQHQFILYNLAKSNNEKILIISFVIFTKSIVINIYISDYGRNKMYYL